MTSASLLPPSRPTSRARGRLRRRMAAVAASALLALAGIAVTAVPASAHDQLISTNPADGSTLASLPAQVTLTFGEVVLDTDGGTQVKVTDSAGTSLNAGATTVKDNVVTQGVTGKATGTVTVLWRVISEDGHPVSGEFTFTVQGKGATIAPIPTATPSPTATAASSGGSPSPILWVVGGIVIVVVAIVVVAVVVSRRRPSDEESSDDRES